MANLTMARNRPPQLKKVNENLYHLDFDTYDEKGGSLIGRPTHLEGTLVEIILKMVLAYRRALQLACRLERKLQKQEKDEAEFRQKLVRPAGVGGGAAAGLIEQSNV